MRALSLMLLSGLSFSALAAQVGPMGYNVSYEQIRNGTMLFPAASCPDVDAKYSEMLEKLTELKTSIQKDANCQDEQAKVDVFAGLAEKGRADFMSLIQKGRSEVLSSEETEKLTSYIEAVTKAGGALTDAIMGSSCFKDDKKNELSMEVIATLINESTAAIATVSGPYGPVIGIGGRITSTLLVSIDKIVRNRRAYDFSDPQQRKVFIKTMCTYHSFRYEIDAVSRVDDVNADWVAYRDALKGTTTAMLTACPECKAWADQYNKDYIAGAPYVRDPMSTLIATYKTQLTPINEKYVLPLGDQTVINMRSLLWVEDEMKKLDVSLSDFGDIERDQVVQMQDTIEDFLFVKQLPRFISAYQSELRRRLSSLNNLLYEALQKTGQQTLGLSTGELIEAVFAQAPADNLGWFPNARERDSYLKSTRSEANRRIGDVVSALMVIEKNCTFARASKSRYEETLYRVCDEASRPLIHQIYATLYRIAGSSHKTSLTVKAAFEVPSPALMEWAEVNKIRLPMTGHVWTSSWQQSLVLLMDQLKANDPLIYELRKK